MSLLDDVRGLAEHLLPSEVPTGAEASRILGGLLTALEHEGLKVADDLVRHVIDSHQPSDPAAPDASAPASASQAPSERERELEAQIAQLEQQLADAKAADAHAESPVSSQPANANPAPGASAGPRWE